MIISIFRIIINSSSSPIHLSDSTDSPSPVDINDDLTVNITRNSSEISFGKNANLLSDENNTDFKLGTVRERKLLEVSRLFNLCYRTVIPNRPPTIAPSTNSLPSGLSAFNPRPIGKNLI
jgi:hypothetical protein